MNVTITLVIFNEISNIEWEFGSKYSIDYSVKSLLSIREEILKDTSDYILFWDCTNPIPKKETIEKVLKTNGNLWHIGTKLGLNAKPYLLDFIQPTSMLHLNISSTITHSSWKNTFKGCLLEKRVFTNVTISNYSNSLDIIGLDFGYNAMKLGVITRYSVILSDAIKETSNNLRKLDELLFIRNNFDSKAFFWSYLLSFFKISPFTFFKAYKNKENYSENIFNQDASQDVLKDKDLSVSIVIATLERYHYLEKELEELRLLEPAMKEIIIVDQTPKEKRSKEFLQSFDDLPIVYLETDKIGQCTARNKGIEVAKSKFIWFLDDDMEEIPTNYLEKHLITIYSMNADISCGIPDEIGTNYIDRSIPKIELSDGFPTNDVLVKTDFLLDAGGFDVKMDQKQSEDQEIGLRLMKNGALSVKNNQLRIVHLRANRGGLRNHNVRKITFASSRKSVFQRRFLHYSEIYLNLKHFSKEQVLKSLLLNIRGTFIIHDGIFKKFLKFLFSLLILPNTLLVLNRRLKQAKMMMND